MLSTSAWVVFSLSLYIALAGLLYNLLFQSASPTISYLLPKTCLPGNQEQSQHLCYSCFRRDLNADFGSKQIQIKSNTSFYGVTFNEKIEYTCDELFKLVDSTALMNMDIFRLEQLNTAYQTMELLGGIAYKVNFLSIFIHSNVSATLIVQKIEKSSTIEDGSIKAKTTTQETSQKLVRSIEAMALLSTTMAILLILVRLYLNLKFKYTSLCVILLSILVFLLLYRHQADILIIFHPSHKFIEILVIVTLTLDNKNIKYILPFLLVMTTFDEVEWLSGLEVLIFFLSCLPAPLQTHERQNYISCQCNLLLFLINKTSVCYAIQPHQSTYFILLHWLVLLFSSNINSWFGIGMQLQAVKPLESRVGHYLKTAEEELSNLKQ